MAIIGGDLGVWLLKSFGGQGERDMLNGASYDGTSKIETLLGRSFWQDIRDKVVIDFGCGPGKDSIEMARHGARKVIGVDIQERFLDAARISAFEAGVAERCEFVTSPSERADVIVALDSFEHFENPAEILQIMSSMLKPDGKIIAAFGPTWYHPYGGHLFSIFPWSHLVFTEAAQCRWRSTFKKDGARRFCEVAGGLNQMTIARFRELVEASSLEFDVFEPVPIRRLKWLANPLTREFTTAIVRCKLRPRRAEAPALVPGLADVEAGTLQVGTTEGAVVRVGLAE
ncbi:MAG TPA: class I SAM-dependent methyltransferase [Pseudomonadales bacterium]